MYRIKTIIAAVLAFMVCCAALINPNENVSTNVSAENLDQQISEYRQKLEELDRKQEELEAQMNSTEASIGNELERQALLDSQIQNTYDKISTMQTYISELEDEIALLDSQIREIELSIETRQEQIDTGIEDFGRRLRAMYITGEGKYAEIILDSGDFYDTLMRMELIKRVAGYDNQVIDELVDLKKQQEAEAVALENKRADITDKMLEYTQELTDLEQESEELQELYAESTKSIEELEKWQSEYLEQQKLLDQSINDAESGLSDLEKQKQEEERRLAFEREQQRLLEEQRWREEQKKREEEERQAALNGQQDGGNSVDNSDDDNYDEPDNSDSGQSGNSSGSDNSGSSSGTTYSGDIAAVINMARSMVGGRYSWGAATPTASDCSGLTMLCYSKIGINLPHKASAQASYGRAVSYSEMKPGDLIFYGGSSYSSIYHVALYIGDGKIIHAENYNTGIVLSYSDTFARYNHITVIKRLVE